MGGVAVKREVKVLLIVMTAIGVGGACLGCAFPLDFVVTMAAGWAFYLLRVVPETTVDITSAVTALLALILFSLGLHKFCLWLYRQTGNSNQERQWKLSWSSGLVWGIELMFCAGTASIGVVHQLVWMFTSKFPWLDAQREVVWRTHSRNNMKQFGIAAHNYHDEFASFPAGATLDPAGRPLHSWITQSLPYWDSSSEIKIQELHGQIQHDLPWSHPRNQPPLAEPLNVVLNPGVLKQSYYHEDSVEFDAENRALAHYAANIAVLGVGRRIAIKDITDGTSNTLLTGEVNSQFRAWGDPLNLRDVTLGINHSPAGFGSPFQGGAFFLRVDGSVHFVSENIDPDLLKATATPDGGEADTIPGGIID